jgi:hypothetical protein
MSLAPTWDNSARGQEYLDIVASGQFEPRFKRLEWIDPLFPEALRLAQFTYANLENPVPTSAYYDARFQDCWGKQSHCGTITDDTYRPRLMIRNKIWNDFAAEAYLLLLADTGGPANGVDEAGRWDGA